MGSGCTKSGPESVPRELAAGEAADEATEETTAGQVVEGKKGEAEEEDGRNGEAKK